MKGLQPLIGRIVPASKPATKPAGARPNGTRRGQPPAEDILRILPKNRATKMQEPESSDGLPGHNPYDAAVSAGFSYAAAKQREEVRLLDEKIKQAKIDTETAQIALERERLASQEARGTLIAKTDYLAKQEAIVSTLKELVRLVISECEVLIPAEIRDVSIEKLERKSDAAFTAIALAVVKGKTRDAVIHSMNEAFRVEDA
jgi:hypothetical protein